MVPTELMKPMKQLRLADMGFLAKARKQIRSEALTAEVGTVVVPWSHLDALIEPYYPKKVNGHPPMPLGAILRIYFMQPCFGQSDPTMEEALHDIPLLRQFAGLDVLENVMPDESTILRFRHFLEQRDLTIPLFAEVARDITRRAGTSNTSGRRATSRSSPTKITAGGKLNNKQKAFKWMLSAIQAIVKHPFRVIKLQLDFVKVRCGLKKNTGQIVTLAYLWLALKRLQPPVGEVHP